MSKNEYIVKVEEHLHCWVKIKADNPMDAKIKALDKNYKKDDYLGIKDNSLSYNVVKSVPKEYRNQ
jgi:predicted TIM-barrel fold metal-dependent hydrolase